MRRLLQLHPQIRRVFHENFLLKRCADKQALLQTVSQMGINVDKDNWGEKVPFFPSARKYPIIKYCQQWNSMFGKKSRILHIVRHPYDVALSNVKKFNNISNVEKPIRIYKKIMPNATVKIDQMKRVYTFKYEDLLMNPDEMMFKIYKFCGVKPDVDYKQLMKRIKNERYQHIDASRAFAYKKEKRKWKFDMKDVFEVLNSIDGIRYEL